MILKPTKQLFFNKTIYGFDIETYNKNKSFLCATLYDGKKHFVFEEKNDLIDFFKKKRFKDSWVVATNLSFDFWGTFYKTDESKDFQFLNRGSNLIFAKTYIHDKKFNIQNVTGRCKPTYFIDTLNYALMSVEQIGNILKIPKLEQPEWIGKRKWNNNKEKNEMIEYNKIDAEISQKFMVFLAKGFQKLGASVKPTIASTSLSCFKNKYLKNSYWRHDLWKLDYLFEGYYGGNTQAFSRGYFKDYRVYDFASLYPSVMVNEYPDPNSVRYSSMGRLEPILQYEGMSLVTINAPYQEYPLLPLRFDNKLLFPFGTFKAWYTHLELRRATDLGYKILKVHKSLYYKDSCFPFKDYIMELWDLRKQYKKEKSPMEKVVKLLMNSLYGKFGQKYRNKDNIISIDTPYEILNKYEYIEPYGEDFFKIKQELVEPSAFCIPIWAAYTTAMGRIKLHEWSIRTNPIYCDTDSIFTKMDLDSSNKLGGLEFEEYIKEGIIVKPKFYLKNDTAKIKGVGVKITKPMFKELMHNPKIGYDKFCKFREAVTRGFQPNEIIPIIKELGLEDDKRNWSNIKFNPNELQSSRPHFIEHNKIFDYRIIYDDDLDVDEIVKTSLIKEM